MFAVRQNLECFTTVICSFHHLNACFQGSAHCTTIQLMQWMEDSLNALYLDAIPVQLHRTQTTQLQCSTHHYSPDSRYCIFLDIKNRCLALDKLQELSVTVKMYGLGLNSNSPSNCVSNFNSILIRHNNVKCGDETLEDTDSMSSFQRWKLWTVLNFIKRLTDELFFKCSIKLVHLIEKNSDSPFTPIHRAFFLFSINCTANRGMGAICWKEILMWHGYSMSFLKITWFGRILWPNHRWKHPLHCDGIWQCVGTR